METVGQIALGSLLPSVVPRPLLYVAAIGAAAWLLRKQIRRFLR